MNRVVFGAISGVVATMAMTTAMRRFASLLPPEERYPLPPSELVGRVEPGASAARHHLETVSAHFGYGAAMGALYGLMRGRMNGPVFGVSIWAISYLGWIPAVGLLRPASSHPLRRNLLMIAVHAVWGRVLSATFRELEESRGMFGRGKARDAPRPALPPPGRGEG